MVKNVTDLADWHTNQVSGPWMGLAMTHELLARPETSSPNDHGAISAQAALQLSSKKKLTRLQLGSYERQLFTKKSWQGNKREEMEQ